jgi:hypothetical protein
MLVLTRVRTKGGDQRQERNTMTLEELLYESFDSTGTHEQLRAALRAARAFSVKAGHPTPAAKRTTANYFPDGSELWFVRGEVATTATAFNRDKALAVV